MAAAAAEAERSVCCLPCAPMAPGGIVNRLMGTCDIDGNGTTFNLPDGSPFECAGPFILGDLVSMPKVEMFKAPFCAHPHSGACVCSILMEGKEFRPWDNHRGAEPELLLPGGIYMLDAGRGCVHDEKPDAISVRGATKALFAEGDDPTGTGFSFCQLWFNPGRLESADERPMRSQVIAPAAIPLVSEGPLSLRVLGGSYKGSASPLELPHELLLLHGRLEGGAAAPIELPPHFEGFIALVKDSGEGAVGSQPLSLGQVGRIGAGAAPLTLRATSDAPIFFLLGAGVPHEQPFAKLLGFGGALVEATPEAVRAKMQKCLPSPSKYALQLPNHRPDKLTDIPHQPPHSLPFGRRYAEDPSGFGREEAGLPDLSDDLRGYEMVEGFQNKADGLMPGVRARWTVAPEANAAV